MFKKTKKAKKHSTEQIVYHNSSYWIANIYCRNLSSNSGICLCVYVVVYVTMYISSDPASTVTIMIHIPYYAF
jgi:hypothetical protein